MGSNWFQLLQFKRSTDWCKRWRINEFSNSNCNAEKVHNWCDVWMWKCGNKVIAIILRSYIAEKNYKKWKLWEFLWSLTII